MDKMHDILSKLTDELDDVRADRDAYRKTNESLKHNLMDLAGRVDELLQERSNLMNEVAYLRHYIHEIETEKIEDETEDTW